jgi:hypothetical protein
MDRVAGREGVRDCINGGTADFASIEQVPPGDAEPLAFWWSVLAAAQVPPAAAADE